MIWSNTRSQYIDFWRIMVLLCALAVANTAYAQEIALTSKSNGGGQLPSGYDKVTFRTYNGNWVRHIALPLTPADNAQVVVSSGATYRSYLDARKVDGSAEKLTIYNGNRYIFTFSAENNHWKIEGSGISYLTPGSDGAEIPDKPGWLMFYTLSDDDWAGNITLPTQAANGAILVIRSNAAATATIHTNQPLFHESKRRIKTGEFYRFVYNGSHQQWLISHSPYREISLTSNNNGGGQLPSGYDKISFRTYDGNWVRHIALPLTPADNAQVVVSSGATYHSYLDASKVDGLTASMTIYRGDTYSFTFNAVNKLWRIEGAKVAYLGPNSDGATMLDNPARLTFYTLSDDDWTDSITLPAKAANGTSVIVRSSASELATINSDHLMYSSTTRLKKGDSYRFTYNGSYQRWMISRSPERYLKARHAATIPPLTAPTTRIRSWNGNWTRTMRLPSAPGDRDKLIFDSSATWAATVVGNINNHATLRVNRGDKYELTYIAEQAQWEVTKFPITHYQAGQLAGGRVPGLIRPHTIIHIGDDNWVPNVYLPIPSAPNSRITIKTKAQLSVSVRGVGNSYQTETVVRQDEPKSFIVDANRQWQQETRTIDMLMVYSHKVADRLGESAAQARMFHSLGLTNEALENSGANYRLRLVGLKKLEVPDHWNKLGHPLGELRNNSTVQGWRNTLKADAIYYLGTERGCGVAWVGGGAYNMVGTGSISCGTTVMRHEFGHNMGLNHGVWHNSNGKYAVGYSAVRSIMGGNRIPYYSTPRRFTSQGIPMGIEGQIDAVRAMNERSLRVSRFR